MVIPKHRTLEFRVLDVLWRQGPCSVRQIEDGLPEGRRPSYETVRSIVYRLQSRKAIRCSKRVGKQQIFEAVIGRQEVQQQLIDDFASLFAPDIKPVIDRLVATGRLTLTTCAKPNANSRKGARPADPSRHELVRFL
ncbi:MAG: BlaI/MecI/CopY family transcriptional regulator [Caulobacteraceae bacterium]